MIPIVILAAGSSSRMGTPKQNLAFDGQTLLQRVIQAAKGASNNVIVVLGANSEVIETTIKDTLTEILYNNDWALGMSSSIKQAISHIQLNYTNADAVAFVVCDQPYVNSGLLKELIKTAGTTGHRIVACSYNGTVGVPALFKKQYFPQLLKLNGKEGAKKVMEQHLQDVRSIPFPLGGVDIDTEEDFNHLLSDE